MLGFAGYAILVYLCNINVVTSNNKMATIILSILVLPPLTILAILTAFYCFDYYVISPNEIIYKKLLRKKIVISKQEVCSIEKSTVFAMIPSIYRSEAYVISNQKNKIPIFVDEKKELQIRSLLEKYGYIDGDI